MQTFLPYPDFQKSARCLDWRRLGKQRVEALQLLKALKDPTYGWQNHPATKMWRGYPDGLAVYMNCCIQEWVLRGYKNTMKLELEGLVDQTQVRLPRWIGQEDFHTSHQSNLLRKNPEWYRTLFVVSADLPYIWPTT